MPQSTSAERNRKRRYRRARVRQLLFTVGPNRISRGRVLRRHLARDVVVREVDVSSPRWPSEFDGLRIGHVSDFHLGELLPLDRAIAVVEQLHDREPDLIACTGDVVDLEHHQAGALFEALGTIPSPLGAMLVLGNHDELHCPETIASLAQQAGITVLRNEAIRIFHNNGSLTVGGTRWGKTTAICSECVNQTCGEESIDLLLTHNPKAFWQAAELEIPLTLAGHTHGGQIAMKNRPNANLAISHRHRVGLFSHGSSRLYVTAGVGAWFPVRINCPAEIAMITMRCGEDNHPDKTEARRERRR